MTLNKFKHIIQDTIAIILASLGFTASILIMSINIADHSLFLGIGLELLTMVYCILCGALFYKQDSVLMHIFHYPFFLAIFEIGIILGYLSLIIGTIEVIGLFILVLYHHIHTYKESHMFSSIHD